MEKQLSWEGERYKNRAEFFALLLIVCVLIIVVLGLLLILWGPFKYDSTLLKDRCAVASSILPELRRHGNLQVTQNSYNRNMWTSKFITGNNEVIVELKGDEYCTLLLNTHYMVKQFQLDRHYIYRE